MKFILVQKGFTLVETLVCVAITGIVAGVAMPVMQDAREEARRVACANRLAEITLGSFQYQEINGRMPPLTTSDGPTFGVPNLNDDQNTGALAYILPFIGEEELFDLIPGVALDPSTELGLDTNPISSFADLLSDPSMVIANNTQFPSVICPSNADYLDEPIGRLFYTMVQDVEEPSLMWIVTLNTNGSTDFGRTSYVPSLGGFHVQQVLPTRQIEISLEDAAGPMRNRLTSIHNDQLGDGASNTVCWSESLGYDLEDDIIFNGDLPGANFALHSPGLVTGIDWITGFGEDGPTRALFGEAGNSLPWLIGSNHLGANNVAFCDGSVRFLSNRTSRGVITALGCGNDGFVAQRTK